MKDVIYDEDAKILSAKNYISTYLSRTQRPCYRVPHFLLGGISKLIMAKISFYNFYRRKASLDSVQNYSVFLTDRFFTPLRYAKNYIDNDEVFARK